MADPLLHGHYPMRGLYQALAVAAMCLQEQAATRPLIADVVTALSYLASQTYDQNATIGSNKVDSSTPRRSTGHRNAVGDSSHSPYWNSPDSVPSETAGRVVSFGAEVGRSEFSTPASGNRLCLDDELETQSSGLGSRKDSPIHTLKARDSPKNIDRERAIAEAKVWGENWRDRKRPNQRTL